ncbi:NIPSNAP family protein [Stappia indica]|uniref:NIPSNAP family protein n=1 Tax=Stappia indica TaxID=538381 RepID=UPI000834B278|nr:NIPSNAP family protein [Stappia indica]
MIYEERTYSLVPGKVGDYLERFERDGLAIQTRFLGDLKGYFTTESGALNQVVHIWRFESFEDRARRRAQLWSDPEWIAYADGVLPLITSMENRFLQPTRFSPMT